MFGLEDTLLIMAAVHWRRDNLLRILDAAKRGGVKNVLLIRDSWVQRGDVLDIEDSETALDDFDFGKGINLWSYDKIRGYGARWYAAAQTDFPIVQILDDDLWIEPAYFAHNLNQLLELYQSHGAQLISLGGFLSDIQTYRDIGHPAPTPERLNTCQNNSVTFFSSVARGMVAKMSDVLPVFYGKSGEDEGPISCYCWMRQIPMYRPAGGQPVVYWPPYQNDERGLFVSCSSKTMYPLRQLLYNRYGWRWKGTST